MKIVALREGLWIKIQVQEPDGSGEIVTTETEFANESALMVTWKKLGGHRESEIILLSGDGETL